MEKKYDHLQAEHAAQQLWEQEKTYITANNPGESYTIDTPPPTVSGSLHIGHIFSYTQTDIIARYKRMSGFSVFYPFGFDDNGLPTERFVEKQRGVSAHSMGRSAFIKLCLEETHTVELEFKQLWQKIGLSVDWDQCYSTIDDNSRKISQQSFLDLFAKGFVYRKDEPALFCTTCRTSVAQAELDDAERATTFNDITFELTNGEKVTISTTRPELLPSCVALLYNPTDSRYQHLKNQKARVPLFGYEVPILTDELVIPEKGTGLVMVCTFGDKTDIEWFKKLNLPYRPSIGLDGKFLPTTGELAGLTTYKARARVIELLKESRALFAQKAINHNVSIHERCKSDIEYLMLPQWFLALLPYKKELIELANKIAWYPAFMKSRYVNWVENLNWDWCLSRQRFYGIPFPVWHCKSCNTIIPAQAHQLPLDPQETPYNGTCPNCNGSEIVPDSDVMDTWNTSSLTPYLCASLAKKSAQEFLPMSMRPQAHDIIRTWAFYTIAKAWMHDKTIPWKDIVISGHVLSTASEKISKSQGNAPLAPENLLKTYSADALRYWTASGNLGQDIAFSDSQIKIGQRLITKLWNAFLFVREHGKPHKNIAALLQQSETSVHAWLFNRIQDTQARYTSTFNNNEFSLALDAIERFFWQDFCDNYLELVKDRLFNPQNYSESEVAATQATLYNVGLRILQLYAPFIPHVTETIYQNIYKTAAAHPEPVEGSLVTETSVSSLHATKFADFNIKISAQNTERISLLLDLVGLIRKFKSDNSLSLKTDIALLTISAPIDKQQALKAEETLLKGVTRALTVEYTDKSSEHAGLKQHETTWHAFVQL